MATKILLLPFELLCKFKCNPIKKLWNIFPVLNRDIVLFLSKTGPYFLRMELRLLNIRRMPLKEVCMPQYSWIVVIKKSLIGDSWLSMYKP
jgi:hypothetical protein